MHARDGSRVRPMLVRGILPATLACLLLPLACRDEPTGATDPARRQQALSPIQGANAAIAVPEIGTDLVLPLSDTVTSGIPAFEIKQKGGGIGGRFEITNPNSSAIALDGVSSGTGHALLAWNLGLGRAAVLIQTNANNTLPAVDVSTSGRNGALEASVNSTTNADTAIVGDTRGVGPAGSFVVLNGASASPALTASTVGVGPAALLTGRGNNNSANALAVVQAGTGRALFVDHRGPGGGLATFALAGVNKARINRDGRGFFNGGTQSSGADVAEAFAVEGRVRDYGPGDVLVISARSDRTVERSSEPYSTLVAGVHATRPGVLLTERHIDASMADLVPMGVVGVIPTRVSGENGAIRRGDLLVTAGTPGHAMRGTERDRMLGAVLGKALENFDAPGTGMIRVLVNVQ